MSWVRGLGQGMAVEYLYIRALEMAPEIVTLGRIQEKRDMPNGNNINLERPGEGFTVDGSTAA